MSLEVAEAPVRRTRQKPVDPQHRREVQAAAAPIIARVGRWQVALTLVKAKASRANANPLQLIGTCRGIAQEVASGRRIMHRAVPDKLRSHGRVLDIERSLAMIECEVKGVLRDLAASSASSQCGSLPQGRD